MSNVSTPAAPDCSQVLSHLEELATHLLHFAATAEDSCRDDGCLVVFGVARDAAHAIGSAVTCRRAQIESGRHKKLCRPPTSGSNEPDLNDPRGRTRA